MLEKNLTVALLMAKLLFLMLLIVGSLAFLPAFRRIIASAEAASMALDSTIEAASFIVGQATKIPAKVTDAVSAATDAIVALKPAIASIATVIRPARKAVESAAVLVETMDSTVAEIRDKTVPTLDKSIERASDGIAAVTDKSVLIIKDGQDSWDDLYPDIKSGVESITVVAASAGEHSESAAKSLDSLAVSVAGMAYDGRVIADKFTKPRSFWGKAWDLVKVSAGFASKL